MRFCVGIALLCLFVNNTQAQKKAASLINDFSVSLHEETVNKVLTALGDINGTSDFEVLLVKGTYTWTVKNAKINIRPDSSFFTCDALVKTSFFEYSAKVPGTVKIDYDSDKNIIYIKITRAIFEVYTMVFGKKIHIKDIHLEERFKDPFTFEGPRTISTVMEFPMPDSTKKVINIQPTDCRMELKWKEICTSCEIKATEVIPITPKAVAAPENTKTEEKKRN